MACACFPNVSHFPIPETLLPVSVFFCFQDANYAYATQQGILTKIRACEHLQKFCENEQTSTHLIFVSNSSKGQILRALSNRMGPFDTPASGCFVAPLAITYRPTRQVRLGSLTYFQLLCPAP